MTTRADVARSQKTRNVPVSAILRPVRIDQSPTPVPLTAGVTLGQVTSPESVARAAESAILRVAQNVEARLQTLEQRGQEDNHYFMSRREATPHLSLNPRFQCWMFDDFVGINSSTMDGLAGLTSRTSGTGASNTAIAGSAAHPGVIESATGTTATGHASLAGDASAIGLGLGPVEFYSGVYFPTLSGASERYRYKSGLLDSLTATPTDGIYFSYTDDIDSGNWRCVTRSNATSTNSNTGLAVASSTWYALEIRIDGPAERVEFLIDGDLVAVHTTNIPGASGREMGLCAQNMRKTVGTTSRAAHVDYCGLRIDFINER